MKSLISSFSSYRYFLFPTVLLLCIGVSSCRSTQSPSSESPLANFTDTSNCWYEAGQAGKVPLNGEFKGRLTYDTPNIERNRTYYCDFSVAGRSRLDIGVVGDDTVQIGVKRSDGQVMVTESNEYRIFYDINHRATSEVVPIKGSYLLDSGLYILVLVFNNTLSSGYFSVDHRLSFDSCPPNEALRWDNSFIFRGADLKSRQSPFNFRNSCGRLILGDPLKCNATRDLYEGGFAPHDIQICFTDNMTDPSVDGRPFQNDFHIESHGKRYFTQGRHILNFTHVDDIALMKITGRYGNVLADERGDAVKLIGDDSIGFDIPEAAYYDITFYLQEFSGDATAYIKFD